MAESTFVLKLKDGTEVMEELLKLAKKESIDYGLLISVSGSMKNFELIANTGENKQKFKETSEVDSISGKIQKMGADSYDMNVRVSLSSSGFSSKSGKLLKGYASDKLEIGIRKVNLKKIIEAWFSPSAGLFANK